MNQIDARTEMKSAIYPWVFVVWLLVLSQFPSEINAQNANDSFSSFDQKWQQSSKQSDAQWDAFERDQQRQWGEFRAKVESKWDTFLDSTKKTWVDYSNDLDARSRVDFEHGTADITAIVPDEKEDAISTGKKQLFDQIKRMLTTTNPDGDPILKGQIRNRKGELVTPGNIDAYIREEILPNIIVDSRPYTAKDGIQRKKYSANIKLIPDHIEVRARQYLPAVHSQAQRFGIEPELILAVIHTESYFNPKAKSHAGAYGLMQLIPRYGAREAYHYIYGQDKVLTPEYLYEPGHNIELGTAYLHVLRNKHYANIRDRIKNCYLSICSYNWGPGAVKGSMWERGIDVAKVKAEELYTFFRSYAPQETSNYLKSVTERMEMYKKMY